VVYLLCRLQDWAAKAADREKAKAERRRERRERMKSGAAKHRFDDPQYDQQKASIAENLEDAMEEGTTYTPPTTLRTIFIVWVTSCSSRCLLSSSHTS